jgi:IS30 family transposase
MSALTLEEREVISQEIAVGGSSRHIGDALGRHHSSIAEEIKRNGGRAD